MKKVEPYHRIYVVIQVVLMVFALLGEVVMVLGFELGLVLSLFQNVELCNLVECLYCDRMKDESFRNPKFHPIVHCHYNIKFSKYKKRGKGKYSSFSGGWSSNTSSSPRATHPSYRLIK